MLEQCALGSFVQEHSEHPLLEAADRTVGGQRQLARMARALLKRSQVLCSTRRRQIWTWRQMSSFSRPRCAARPRSATVLTIAHRLNTIMESDRVLVMDGGASRAAPPTELRNTPGSIFGRLCDASDNTEHAQ